MLHGRLTQEWSRGVSYCETLAVAMESVLPLRSILILPPKSSDGSPSEKGAAATSSNHDSGPLEMNANTAGSSKISTSLMQKERTRKKTAAWVIGILRQAFAPKVGSRRQGEKHRPSHGHTRHRIPLVGSI